MIKLKKLFLKPLTLILFVWDNFIIFQHLIVIAPKTWIKKNRVYKNNNNSMKKKLK